MTHIDVYHRDADARRRDGLWADIDAAGSHRVLVLHAGRIAEHADGSMLWPAAVAPPGERVYLGQLETADEQHAIELRLVDHWDGVAHNLRSRVGQLTAGLNDALVTALALANWRAGHRHCPRCAHLLVPEHAGWMLSCPGCGSQHWPRTDPAVIVRIEDDHGRILLGSNASWERNRYSLLAGFVEPGESLEAAVVREVFEESGVHVVDPRYLTSQGWPFPMSLMLGFAARAVSLDVVPDGEEILDLRWFDRDSILSSGIALPRRGSVARALVEDWFGRPIPEPDVES